MKRFSSNKEVTTRLDILRQVSTNASSFTYEERKEVETLMSDSFYDRYKCKMQGLAAIQLQVPMRLILIRKRNKHNIYFMYDPVVLLKSKRSVLKLEGCLSEPMKVQVLRPKWMFIKYKTIHLKTRYKFMLYKKSRVVMHEIDHLDGILLRDSRR